MAVAVTFEAAFDPRIGRDGIRAGIALVFAFVENHRHHRLIATDHVIRYASRRTMPDNAKVLMQAFLRTNAGNDRIAARVHGVLGDVAIPFIIRRHEQSAAEVGIRACFEFGALRQSQRCQQHYAENNAEDGVDVVSPVRFRWHQINRSSGSLAAVAEPPNLSGLAEESGEPLARTAPSGRSHPH